MTKLHIKHKQKESKYQICNCCSEIWDKRKLINKNMKKYTKYKHFTSW